MHFQASLSISISFELQSIRNSIRFQRNVPFSTLKIGYGCKLLEDAMLWHGCYGEGEFLRNMLYIVFRCLGTTIYGNLYSGRDT